MVRASTVSARLVLVDRVDRVDCAGVDGRVGRFATTRGWRVELDALRIGVARLLGIDHHLIFGVVVTRFASQFALLGRGTAQLIVVVIIVVVVIVVVTACATGSTFCRYSRVFVRNSGRLAAMDL